jgi:amidase
MATDTPTLSYQELAAQKRERQLDLIPAEWRLEPIPSVDSAPNALLYIRQTLSPTELALTEETDITVLLRKLSSGELSSLELTRAFAKRAALAHQLTTCCTEIFFEEAFAVAKEMDEHLATTGKTLGPLHGLPVSIKDLFSVKGVDTSIGMSHCNFNPGSLLVQPYECMDVC